MNGFLWHELNELNEYAHIRGSSQSNGGGYFSDEQKGHFRSESRGNEAIQANSGFACNFYRFTQPLIRSFVFSSSHNQCIELSHDCEADWNGFCFICPSVCRNLLESAHFALSNYLLKHLNDDKSSSSNHRQLSSFFHFTRKRSSEFRNYMTFFTTKMSSWIREYDISFEHIKWFESKDWMQ